MLGSQIRQYKIVEKLGAGGMGEVYLAEDTKLHRKVALKFLPERLSSDPDFESRFEHEARATAALNHPNIVTIHDFGEFEGRMYIVMEHLDGKTLQDMINEGSLTLNQALDVTIQMCEGLSAAHRAGVIHRDIKPANVICSGDCHAKLLDFGLAKSRKATTETKVGSTIGTVQYEAPEQGRGDECDERSDVFSMGVVIYELITGKLPFTGEYDAAIRYAISHETPEPLARYKSGAPDELQRVIDKALAKEPAERYQTVADMLVDIRRVKRDTQPVDRSTLAKAPAKIRLTPILSGIALVVSTVAMYFWLKSDDIEQQPAQVAQQEEERIMVAVLPFENLGSEGDEYFADGITDEITSRVARLEGLGVIARTSILQYKGTTKRVKEIGEELGVDYILEGTIRWDKSGDVNRVRITPQLIKVSDETHVWADNIQRDLSQIFKVQEEIATQIAAALKVRFREGDHGAMTKVPTQDIEAYDSYLRGRSWMERRFHTTAYDSALIHFARAIELDPMYAEAYAWKATTHIWRSFDASVGKTYHENQAREAIERAFAVRPDLPEGILAEGMYFNLVERNYDSAMAKFNQIKDLIREKGMVLKEIGVVRMRQGKWELAKEAFNDALLLDPYSPATLMLTAYLYDFLRDYDTALRFSTRLTQTEYMDPYGYYERALLHIKKDRDMEAARAEIAQIPGDLGLAKILVSAHMYYDFFGATPVRFGLVDIPDSAIDNLAKEILTVKDESRFGILRESIVADLYAYSGDSARAKAHYDSVVAMIEPYLRGDADVSGEHALEVDHHVRSWAALTYAKAGDFDKAFEHGALALKQMPLEECHW